MKIATEFLIVGCGVVGASLAYELVRAGASDILVVDAEATGSYHASRRSAAMFMAGYGNAVVRALTRASLPFFRSPPEGFAEADLLVPRGHLTIAASDEVDLLERAEGERIDPAMPTIAAHRVHQEREPAAG